MHSPEQKAPPQQTLPARHPNGQVSSQKPDPLQTTPSPEHVPFRHGQPAVPRGQLE